MIRSTRKIGAILAILLAGGLAGCEDTTDSIQSGPRGTGMVQFTSPSQTAALTAANAVPEAQPEAAQDGPRASEVYENVQVLGHLSEEEFLRTMNAITEWVAPVEGCGYCHNLENLADDSVYTKGVARRMFQMTWTINDGWQPHVQQTGVTCYTCHRGNPVPTNVWYQNPGPLEAQGMAATGTGQNKGDPSIGLTSMPFDPYTTLLGNPAEIKVSSTTRLPSGTNRTTQQTEKTYSLMIHMSEGLGVNCTFCHNTQNFSSWDLSTPKRVTAWHGIRMASEVNATYIAPLAEVFPANRKGPLGDPYKVNCATCHQGASKPLLGVSMLKDYVASLGKAPTQP